MARMRRKGDLPTKVCATCGRPFAWRRKWAKDWDAVRHCSEACRARRGRTGPGGDGGGDGAAPGKGRMPPAETGGTGRPGR